MEKTTEEVLQIESSIKTQGSQECNIEKINTDENATLEKIKGYSF